MSLEIKLSDDQLDTLAERIAARLDKASHFNRPLSMSEVAKALNVSVPTVSRRIAAGLIRTIPGIGVPRVPQSEIRRLIGDQ